MKRYAIVPLDRYNCPKYYYEWFKCKHCGNCAELWGDTKEQLIRKVAQAIKISLRQGFTKGYKEIATDVIEFLGVE